MAWKDALLQEFDHETATTRRYLERVPEDRFTWKPHDKSGTLIWTAGHIANIPGWAVLGLTSDSVDLAPGGVPVPQPPVPATVQALVETFDNNVKAAREAIAGIDDVQLARNWSLLMNGETKLTMPRTSVMRIFVMNHLIHHRAQLGVYLRLCGVPVPATYGPSADEGAM